MLADPVHPVILSIYFSVLLGPRVTLSKTLSKVEGSHVEGERARELHPPAAPTVISKKYLRICVSCYVCVDLKRIFY
jgi:hypothetical protein